MKDDSLANRLKMIRESKGLSQEKFSRELGITQQTYSLMENGQRSPNIKVFKILAERFNVNLNWLVTGYGGMFREFVENAEFYEKKNKELSEIVDKFREILKNFP